MCSHLAPVSFRFVQTVCAFPELCAFLHTTVDFFYRLSQPIVEFSFDFFFDFFCSAQNPTNHSQI